MRKILGLLLLIHAVHGSLKAQDSLDIKIGQMLLIGLPSTEVDAKVLDEVRNGKVGSIIFFEKNIPKDRSYEKMRKVIWTYQEAAAIPLFVAIDQEGGLVNRLKEKYGFPRSITAEAMGNDTTMDSVRYYAESTAATLAGLGFNVNFGPVVDLASNPNNPVIAKSGRAFSGDPHQVSAMAREWIIQHRRFGVVTSLKHFPGHGSSLADTHKGMADVTDTWSEQELIPYRELIQGGYADAIMTSHIVHRGLDPEGYPGTLSKDIIEGLLRSRLHWDGVVFSDDMQMHAITKYYGLEEAVKRAILASVDIMIFSNNIAASEERTVDRVHKIVRGLVEQGTIPKERIDRSYDRVIRLKSRFSSLPEMLREQQQTETEIQEMLQKVNELMEANEKLMLENERLKQAGVSDDNSGKKRKKKRK